MSTSGHTANPFSLPKKAAVDITTGYGADSFLRKTGYKDPWGKDCFIRIVDTGLFEDP